MVKVKICGMTSAADARAAVELGADALGFIFAKSPRQVTKERAKAIMASLPPFVTGVGVFVDEDPDVIIKTCLYCGLDTVQLHGDERPRVLDKLRQFRIIKAFRIATKRDLSALQKYRPDAYLLDSRLPGLKGGSGMQFDWELARGLGNIGPIILAGGLHPGNVAEAIPVVRPYAVDTSSGVESRPGKKDRQLMEEFIRVAKST